MGEEHDFAGEGLLEGLEGDARAARLDLLHRLAEEGAGVDELKRAAGEGRLALLPVERELTKDVDIGSAELARLCGLDLEFVMTVRHALGLREVEPEEPVFRQADVDAFRELGALRRDAGLPDGGVLEVLEVVGHGLWRISEILLSVVDEAASRSDTDERGLAMEYAEAARGLGPVAGPLLESAMHAHIREGVRDELVTAQEVDSGRVDGTWTVAVCFVDLVGFTKLGDGRPAEQAHSIARGLARIAASVATPPVRLVKTMGDGAMLVSDEVPALVDAALEIMVRSGLDERLPALRGGISYGDAFTRGGDWYGATVNLASRIVEVAEPGTILATESVRRAGPAGYSWSPAGRHTLDGVSEEVELYEPVEQDDT